MKREEILIEADELLQKTNNQNMLVFDASITDDMYLMGHIPGAAYFDHERFSDPSHRYEFMISPGPLLAGQIGAAGISNDSEVIVYACGMLPYAVRAWWVLRYAGHTNVRILNGGLDAWKKAGGQVEKEVHQYAPAAFKANLNPGMLAGKEEVLASIENEEVAIVNVLPQVSYEASHIVGSSCLSALDLMQGMDYLLPTEELSQKLKNVARHKRIITYCGGGIAAAVNAAAHLMTGHENAAIYDGSMYEWLGEGLPVNGNGNWEIWKNQ
ncbi:MAG: sulfurtransferase [Anaerolineales bacterium]|jgi:thiosulfate/3-mercaptopyruvate sulfurtransferase|nr:sulfurtransferase [Anaerolineales bacterium]MCC6986546.1 sulfurtransferase [Anaerolineales bacterium]